MALLKKYGKWKIAYMKLHDFVGNLLTKNRRKMGLKWKKSIKTVKTKTRHMGLEWLRIVSMLMIILLHSIDHSGLYETLVPGTSIYYVEQFLYALVQVCVNCFILISGYFLVNFFF